MVEFALGKANAFREVAKKCESFDIALSKVLYSKAQDWENYAFELKQHAINNTLFKVVENADRSQDHS